MSRPGGVWPGGAWPGGAWPGGVWPAHASAIGDSEQPRGVWRGGAWPGGVRRGGACPGGVWPGGVWSGGAWLGGLRAAAAQRERLGLRRVPRPRGEGEDLVDLAGNDYLGLSRHPEVLAAASAAVKAYGLGATGSRLVRGSTDVHTELESALAEFLGCEAALVYSSGYLANLGAVRAFGGALIASDAHNHASLVDGCRLARADRGGRTVVYAHADPDALAAALGSAPANALLAGTAPASAAPASAASNSAVPDSVVPDSAAPTSAAPAGNALAGVGFAGCEPDAAPADGPALALTESVFSVHGDLAPLVRLHAVARGRGAVLCVDDAHAVGVLGPDGRGGVAQAGLAGEPDVVVTATLSKAFGAAGGVVGGPAAYIEHLVQTSRSFIYDTGLAPAAAAGALAALALIRGEAGEHARAELAGRAAHACARLRDAGLAVREPAAGVLSVGAGGPTQAVAWAAACRAAGVAVGCFRPPSTPDGESRLRLTINVGLARSDFDRALGIVATTARDAGC